MHEHSNKTRSQIKISEVTPISRRYFIINAFDSATTISGIIVRTYTAEITDGFLIVWPCLGATLAMNLSSFVGSYMTEEDERTSKLNSLEKINAH